MSERIDRLEEKIAYLERHITEQDKVMLGMAEEIATLRRELARIRERAPKADDGPASDERPPHY